MGSAAVSRAYPRSLPAWLALQVPKAVSNVPSEVLLPSNCWADKENYTKTLSHLAELFVKVGGGAPWVGCVWRVGLALRAAARLSSSFLPGFLA